VDGDTSTSDTVLAFATAGAGNDLLEEEDAPGTRSFADALGRICLDLAQLVVKDGEGARKFIAITTRGAISDDSARRIGLAIANSPLFKTAIAGEEANWGSIAAAAGAAGEPLDRDRLSISFGAICVAKDGQPVHDHDEEGVSAYLKHPEIEIIVDL